MQHSSDEIQTIRADLANFGQKISQLEDENRILKLQLLAKSQDPPIVTSPIVIPHSNSDSDSELKIYYDGKIEELKQESDEKLLIARHEWRSTSEAYSQAIKRETTKFFLSEEASDAYKRKNLSISFCDGSRLTIRNNSNLDISLAGWKIRHNNHNNSMFVFPNGSMFASHSEFSIHFIESQHVEATSSHTYHWPIDIEFNDLLELMDAYDDVEFSLCVSHTKRPLEEEEKHENDPHKKSKKSNSAPLCEIS